MLVLPAAFGRRGRARQRRRRARGATSLLEVCALARRTGRARRARVATRTHRARLPRLCRRQRPDRHQARARSRRGRRPFGADVGPAGHRQVDARRALSRHPAGDERDRGAGSRRRAIAQRRLSPRALAAPPLPRAAPHRVRRWRWWAAAAIRARARFRWRTTACCFSTSCRSFRGRCWKCCANRWRPATSRFRARRGRPISRRAFSWWPR